MNNKELTLKSLLAIALPMIISQASETIMLFADRLFLSRLGLVTYIQLRSFRKYAILLIFAIAAVITPPDVLSQIMLGLPMIILYEVGIIVAKLFGKKIKEVDNEETEESEKGDD